MPGRPRQGAAPRKPHAAPSRAYVLSQTANLRWWIVDRSGPSRLPEGPEPAEARREPSTVIAGESADAKWTRGAVEAMEASAKARQQTAELISPKGHVLFVAATHDELSDYGVRI